MPYFEYIATEVVTSVFTFCNSIDDVIALSSTCKRFRGIYNGSQRLRILEHATEAQFGPLEDAVQLVTHNESQPAHLMRSVSFSYALLRQVVHVGRVAEKWCNLYPFKKWHDNYEDRRLLTNNERYRFRRALYRLWLYSRAFHNGQHSREHRMNPLMIHERSDLLHNWTTHELAEMADVHAVLRSVVHSNVCPSNGTIARRFTKRHPEQRHALLFNIHLNYPAPSAPPSAVPPSLLSAYHSPPSAFHSSAVLASKHRAACTRYTYAGGHDPANEGWGDDIGHYYVVEDMLKLDPAQILWLKENAPLKGMVERYVRGLGDWFENNGETWVQTLEWVLRERGEEVAAVYGAVADEEMGVAVGEE